MYKIGEFSKMVGIPVRTLRFYDEYGVLQPGEIDNFTGYRYYTDDNLIECELIKILKSVDFTLEEIILYKGSFDINILEKKQREILEKIDLLKKKYKRILIMKDEFQKSQLKDEVYKRINNESEEEKKLRRKYERKNIKKVHNANKNLIIDGVISTGKTKSVSFSLVNEMINSNESLFILDSKEEYIKEFYKKAKEKGYNILIINLRDLNKSEGWNVLEYPYNLYKQGNIDESLNCLEQIGKELFYEGQTTDPFWYNSAANLFTGVVLGLFEDAKENEINLASVNSMFNALDVKYVLSNYLTEYFRSKDISSPAYVSASSTVFAPFDTRSSIVSVAKQRLSSIVSKEKLNKLLSKTTFDLKKIYNEPSIVFFIAKDEESYINSLASVFVKQLYSILINNEVKNKFNFILDNFDSITNFYELSNILSAGISKNIKFTIITRSKKLLLEKYGSYLNYLSNSIYVNESTIQFNVDGLRENIDNIFTESIQSEVPINYPVMNNNFDVAIFDWKKYVNEKNGTPILDFSKATSESNDKINIDEIVKKIDEKIAQLEKEEEEVLISSAKNDINTKSDFEEFKTEN